MPLREAAPGLPNRRDVVAVTWRRPGKYLETDGSPLGCRLFRRRRYGVSEPKAVSRFVPLVVAFLGGLLVLGRAAPFTFRTRPAGRSVTKT